MADDKDKIAILLTEFKQNHGYSPSELNRIRALVDTHHDKIVEAWHEHCG